ncbi:MAG: PD-(D/E)XK nuclease family protein, partial [Sedimentisphaerales bacterium]|nr:PD-(D/E)XK nuclease family protein [Sedimentisphaerales bacterium]
REVTVKAITTALFEILEQLNIATKLSEWQAAALAADEAEQAEIHVEAHRQLLRVFDELVATLGDTLVTLGEYVEIITSALEELSLGLVPPVSDQVLVGVIERSRHPAIRAALVVGAVEKEFPRVSSVDPLLSDTQRERLDREGFELAPGRTRRLLQERYLGYIALTRASERLWVSYPRSDEHGGELARSSLVDELLAVLPDVQVETLDERNTLDTITTPGQLGRVLAGALSGLRYDQPVETEWLSITRQLLSGEQRDFYGRSLAGLLQPRPATLTASMAEAFFQEQTITSVSRLESYGACPFQYFARHMLKLTQREEFELAAVDFGSFYHRGLCEVFKGLQQKGLNWASADAEVLRRLVDDFHSTYQRPDGPAGGVFAASERSRRLLMGAAQRLSAFCLHLRDRAKVSKFEQAWAEVRFGVKPSPEGEAAVFEMLKLGDMGGRGFWLEGIIDRVDVCREGERTGVTIYDYKMSGKPFSWAELYHGLELQLPLYLAVMVTQPKAWGVMGAEPAGAFYLGILGKGQTQEGELPSTWPASQPSTPTHKAQGVLGGDWLSQLDAGIEPKVQSPFYTVYMKADGSLQNSRTKGLLNVGQMQVLMEHSRVTACRWVEGMLAGDIAVAPYRLNDTSPCRYCEMQSVCRFDPEIGGYRFLAPLDEAEAVARLS